MKIEVERDGKLCIVERSKARRSGFMSQKRCRKFLLEEERARVLRLISSESSKCGKNVVLNVSMCQ